MVFGEHYKYKENEMIYSKGLEECITTACQRCIESASRIDLEQACELVRIAYCGFVNDDNELARYVDEGRFISTMRYVAEKNKKIHLLVRWDRKISKWKDSSTVYQDAPDTSQDELSKARKFAIDNPALILLHQTGEAEGWNGAPFW